jgi:hypothetical protein
MAIFTKKVDWDQKLNVEAGGAAATPIVTTSPGSYGIAETIQLMRTLPVEQNGDLVVRVVRATLASLNVHVPEIIEDANRKQQVTQERIAAEHARITDLEKQLAVHRKEIATLEADQKETTLVKERLLLAERTAQAPRIPEAAVTTILGTAPSAAQSKS